MNPDIRPRCPFAPQGLQSAEMQSCDGFQPQALRSTTIPWALPHPLAGGAISCGHLGIQPSARGFVSACLHPGGLPRRAAERSRGMSTSARAALRGTGSVSLSGRATRLPARRPAHPTKHDRG